LSKQEMLLTEIRDLLKRGHVYRSTTLVE